MSFLKIEDPEQRDQLVQEFIDTKERIKQNNWKEKLNDINTQQDLTKFLNQLEIHKLNKQKISSINWNQSNKRSKIFHAFNIL